LHPDWKATIRSTYDARATEYSRRHGMQTGNLSRLIERVLTQHPRLDRILDVGAGSGAAISDFIDTEGDAGTLVCADISRETLLARRRCRSSRELLVQGDAGQLPFPPGCFDLTYANSVLHWLGVESGLAGFQNAVREIIRVTRSNGVIGASIAGVGTAARFLHAYHTVLGQFEQTGGLESEVPDDPIGAMELNDVVDAVIAGGGRIIEAELVYEPVQYRRASDYVLDAAAYGYDTFLSPVVHEQRTAVWQQIADRFAADVGAGPYTHDQYMIYVVATPNGQHAEG
jgi:ubiquinone/menaquinone biosynthesis C-methylase UbiE